MRRLVIFLDAGDEAVVRRKETGRDRQQLRAQRQRLKPARLRADIHLQTDALTPEELVARAAAELSKYF